MTAIRSLLFNLFFFGWLIGLLLFMWLALPFPRRAMIAIVRGWSLTVRGVLRHVVHLDVEVRGQENLPDGGAFILAAKHQSAWDTIAFLWMFEAPAYVLKQELLSIPLWGWYARKCRHIGVDRKGGAAALRGIARDAKAALAAGRPVVIFPEGTRVKPEECRPYHPGAAALYAWSGAPVVPVALNSGLFWGRRSFLKRPGTVVVEFLPPVPDGLDRRAFLTHLKTAIDSASDRLAKEGRRRFAT